MSAVAKKRSGVNSSISVTGFNTSVTTAADDSVLSFRRGGFLRDAWQSRIDHDLLEMARNPAQFAEDELIPPTSESISAAMVIAHQIRDLDGGMDLPVAIIPNGDGGIFFEWGEPSDVHGLLEVKADGSAVFTLSNNFQVVSRQQII